MEETCIIITFLFTFVLYALQYQPGIALLLARPEKKSNEFVSKCQYYLPINLSKLHYNVLCKANESIVLQSSSASDMFDARK